MPPMHEGCLAFMGNHMHRDMWRSVAAAMPGGIPQGVHLIVWDWSFLEKGQLIHERFPFEEYVGLISSRPDLSPVLLIDSANEAPQYGKHLAPLIDWLSDTGVTPRSRILHCTGDATGHQGVASILSDGAFSLGADLPARGDMWRHHFIMLGRVPKPLRVLCAVEILSRGLDGRGYLSCGVNGHASVDRMWIEHLVPYELRHRFPLVLDNAAIADYAGGQFEVADDRIRLAAVNVIAETSQDPSLEVPDPWAVWTDVFITEKTAKAFRLRQLPIWAAVPGTVAEVRRRGFDVFDDLIDHGYDAEPDPRARMGMVADQLSHLCAISMDELSGMRSSLLPRLDANMALAAGMSRGLVNGLASGIRSALLGM